MPIHRLAGRAGKDCPQLPADKERPLQSKLSARDRLGLRLRRAQNGPPTGRPRTAERPCPERARWVLPARGAPPPTADRKVPGRCRGW